MKNTYSLDLNQYSLDQFKASLKQRVLIPSRKVLKNDIDQIFEILGKMGIENMHHLIGRLSNKGKLELFSDNTGIDSNYLNLLRREAASYKPNPVALNKLPGIAPAYTSVLAQNGIKNTKHLFGRAQNEELREQLSKDIGIPLRVIEELYCLSDLCRAYGVGPVFARMIYDVGVTSISDFVKNTPEEFIEIYEEKTGKKADFGADEIRFSVELAKDLKYGEEILLENQNVTLREVIDDDLQVFYVNQNHPEAIQMAAFTPEDPTDKDRFDAHWARIRESKSIFIRTILFKGKVAGSVLSYEIEGKPEVSYWLGQKFWGRGIATTALRRFLAEVNTKRPIYARVAKDNLASCKVLEKCGFGVIGETTGFANARQEEIEELIYKLG